MSAHMSEQSTYDRLGALLDCDDTPTPVLHQFAVFAARRATGYERQMGAYRADRLGRQVDALEQSDLTRAKARQMAFRCAEWAARSAYSAAACATLGATEDEPCEAKTRREARDLDKTECRDAGFTAEEAEWGLLLGRLAELLGGDQP